MWDWPEIDTEVSHLWPAHSTEVEASWNVMAHEQNPDFLLSAKRTIPFKSTGGRQFSRLLAAEVCASAVVMLDTSCSEVVWRVLATHSIRQFPLHFPSRASPCAITFQLDYNKVKHDAVKPLWRQEAVHDIKNHINTRGDNRSFSSGRGFGQTRCTFFHLA